MKDQDEFLKEMENLKVPDVNPSQHQDMVKMAIMNAGRSAALGLWLVIVPCYFLLCVFMYYHFHINASWFSAMFSVMVQLEKVPYIDYIGPLVLFILPVVCIVINLLSITHVQVRPIDPDRRKVKELNISIRLKLWNIVLILISLAIVFAFINFAMTENISIKN
ncbi:hypothetical protein ABIC45_002737 [Mucilaginibacter rubeus]|uniref:hypothetical protein n=1 Tax=Mucilaginibacter rubeus TaxID=2027860 RepID=UPI00339B657E